MHFLANPNAAEIKLINVIKSVGHQTLKQFGMLLIGELRHYSVLIFNFSDIKHDYKIKI